MTIPPTVTIDQACKEAGLLRRTRVEIDLDQLDRNMHAIQDHMRVKLAPVIKADAYGHGAVTIARELEKHDIGYLAVAVLPEAVELREDGIKAPILVMGYTDDEFLHAAVEHDITLTIFDERQAQILAAEAQKRDRVARVHIKVDVGFHRLGKPASPEFADDIVRMSKLPAFTIDGIFAHYRLATRESDREEYAHFTSFVADLESRGLAFRYRHMSDSIGAVYYPEAAMDMVRPGAIIYGYLPAYQANAVDVTPIMTFKSTVTRVQPIAKGDGVGYDDEFSAPDNMVVATVGVGYADGYPRYLSRKAEVLIRGQRAKVLGIICMDQMMVDVSNIPNVHQGDEVILFGPQKDAPSVLELSVIANTNKNCILAGISRRVPRLYLRGGRVESVVNYLAGKTE